MNILEIADKIVNHRSEEKDRQYGPFNECMENMAEIFNTISGNKNTVEDMYLALISLKLARHKYRYKEDSLLDAAAYIGALNNYIQDNPKSKKRKKPKKHKKNKKNKKRKK